MENTNGVLPVMNVGENNGMGGGWLWIVFLFFLIAWGGNGMFGGNANASAISNDFLYTNLKNTMDMGFNQTANQNFQIQKDIANQSLVMQQGCCDINRNIDNAKYEASQGFAATMANDTSNTQKILDKLCMMESNAKDNVIAQLRMDLQAAQLTLGNAAQTTNIVGALKPPTYLAPCAYSYQA